MLKELGIIKAVIFSQYLFLTFPVFCMIFARNAVNNGIPANNFL